MFVTSVATDSAHGAVERPWEQDWDEGTLAALVAGLDGVDRTALVLTGPTDAYLAIGGSVAAGLIVYASFAGETVPLAAGPDEEGTRAVVAGGTVVDYALRYIVEPVVAVRAAWHFARTGELDPDLPWGVPD